MLTLEEALLSRVNSCFKRVQDSVWRQFGIELERLPIEDKVRLLRLEQFETKYKVPLDWILKQLVPFFRDRFSSKLSKGLGVKTATLVGKFSQEILSKEIAKQFPEQEHVKSWKFREQQRQWQTYKLANVLDDNTFEKDFVGRYVDIVSNERALRKEFGKRMKRRPYRDNPWL